MCTHSSHQPSCWVRCLNLRGGLEQDTIFVLLPSAPFHCLEASPRSTCSPSETPPSLHAAPGTPRCSAFGFWVPLCSQTFKAYNPHLYSRSLLPKNKVFCTLQKIKNIQIFEQPGSGSLLSFRFASSVFFSCLLLPTASLLFQSVLPAALSDGHAAVAHHCSCASQPGSKIYLCYDCFHHQKAGFPAFSWSKHSFGALILTSYCFSPYASNLRPLTY